jgi:hypothetical protein
MRKQTTSINMKLKNGINEIAIPLRPNSANQEINSTQRPPFLVLEVTSHDTPIGQTLDRDER